MGELNYFVVSKHISVIYLRSIIIAYLAKLNELSSTMSSGFITESEAIDIRKKRQEEWEKVRSATDPIERPEEPYDSRSLYDRLQEQKQKKDLEYEEAHKLKNMIKGLDDDEIDFLELVDKTKMAADLKKSQEEEQELNDYRNRVATLQEKALDQKLGIAVPNKPKAANQNNKRSQMKLLQGAVVKKEENSKKRKVSEEQEEEEGSNSKAGTTVVPSALKCIGILPGMGCYSDSSSEDTSDSDSEIENEDCNRNCQKRGRGQHGGDKHGSGNKGSGQRQNYMRLGYETGNNPFYLRFPMEPYYKGHHLRRQYPPLSMEKLQLMIDLSTLDATKPIDLVSLINTGHFKMNPDEHHFGVHLTDEGADLFKVKVNIEVQWASELVIAAIERAGGTITTAYYDPHSLQAMMNTKKFFQRGTPIPKRMIPPPDAIEYYADPTKRGYLADPEKISQERLVLAQKYGYTLPKIEEDPDYEMLCMRKDPRQIFYGLNPGWVINLKDKVILKPQDPDVLSYYNS